MGKPPKVLAGLDRAAAEGSEKYLRRVAPEVRVVAEESLREIEHHLYET